MRYRRCRRSSSRRNPRRNIRDPSRAQTTKSRVMAPERRANRITRYNGQINKSSNSEQQITTIITANTRESNNKALKHANLSKTNPRSRVETFVRCVLDNDRRQNAGRSSFAPPAGGEVQWRATRATRCGPVQIPTSACGFQIRTLRIWNSGAPTYI